MTSAAASPTGPAALCRALQAAGVTAVAVEDPGWHRLREAAPAPGCGSCPSRSTTRGCGSATSTPPDVRAVIVEPGAPVPDRRGALAGAPRRACSPGPRRVDGLILEDDYDAEFRYDRRPVGDHAGHRPRPGGAARVACPRPSRRRWASAGWSTPPAWTRPFADHGRAAGRPPMLDQLAFAAFMEPAPTTATCGPPASDTAGAATGWSPALAERLPGARLLGVAAGLHLLVHLDGAVDCAGVVARAAAAGVRVANLDTYRVRDDAIGPGLVLGYGNLADGQVEEAVTLLAAAARP